MPVQSRGRILVVEDDVDLRRLYKVALRLGGFDVSESGDGLSALVELEFGLPPACVVLDLLLPLVSGHLVMQDLRASAERSEIPVVIVTGSDEPLTHLDPACVLRKPATPEQLVLAVERCLASVAATSSEKGTGEREATLKSKIEI